MKKEYYIICSNDLTISVLRKRNEEQILTSEYMILKYKHMGKAKRMYTCVLRVRSVLIFFSKAALRILISSSFFNLYSVNKLYKMSYIICH